MDARWSITESEVKMSLKKKIKWFVKRLIISESLKIQAKEEYRERRRRSLQDRKFLKDTDKKLTKEQVQEIHDFWKKYEFAYKPRTVSVKAYYNRNGIFDPRYIPHGLRDKQFIRDYWANHVYMYAVQDKTWLDKIFKKIRQPESVIRKMSGMFYDSEFNLVTKERAVEICKDYIMNGEELIFKPSGSKGGLGIVVIGKDTVDDVDHLLTTMTSPTVVQKLIKQHPDLKKLNEDSVNSLRLTTLLYKGEFTPLAAFVKVGKAGNRVDNFFAGGVVVGVDIETGEFYDWALTKKNNRRKTLPNGIPLDTEEKMVFPEYKKVLEIIEKTHYEVPMIKVVSWDVTVDEDGEPVLIEPNFGGDLRVNQALTGPILGDMTEMILDDMLLKKFFKLGANLNFDFKEYHDHITITKYCGLKANVVVPAEINGKPVRYIAASAFRKNEELKTVSLPDTVKLVKMRAFEFCRNMERIDFPKNVKLEKDAVYKCGECNTK